MADEFALERAIVLDFCEMVATLSDARGITLDPVCALLAGDPVSVRAGDAVLRGRLVADPIGEPE